MNKAKQTHSNDLRGWVRLFGSVWSLSFRARFHSAPEQQQQQQSSRCLELRRVLPSDWLWPVALMLHFLNLQPDPSLFSPFVFCVLVFAIHIVHSVKQTSLVFCHGSRFTLASTHVSDNRDDLPGQPSLSAIVPWRQNNSTIDLFSHVLLLFFSPQCWLCHFSYPVALSTLYAPVRWTYFSHLHFSSSFNIIYFFSARLLVSSLPFATPQSFLEKSSSSSTTFDPFPRLQVWTHILFKIFQRGAGSLPNTLFVSKLLRSLGSTFLHSISTRHQQWQPSLV